MTRLNITNIPADLEQWRHYRLAELVEHIVMTHHGYLREELPIIGELLVARDAIEPLTKIFLQFRRGMEEHMKKEEAILFPMIEKIERARVAGQEPPRLPFGSIEHPIAVMEQEHERARRELAEIRALTGEYTTLAGLGAEPTSVLEKFRTLDADLEIHSRLEDEVLFPRAIGLERI
jgi:regulator of cell morphogenesis and NO signaling